MEGQRVVWPDRAKVDIETFTLPPVGDDEVLVATECTLISPGTERAFLLGLPNAQGRYPTRPGYSNIGRIIEVGKQSLIVNSVTASLQRRGIPATL